MRGLDFKLAADEIGKQAAEAAQKMLAILPDDQIQSDIVRPRELARDRGIEFDRIVREGNHYGFYLGDKATAVIIRGKTQYDIHYNP